MPHAPGDGKTEAVGLESVVAEGRCARATRWSRRDIEDGKSRADAGTDGAQPFGTGSTRPADQSGLSLDLSKRASTRLRSSAFMKGLAPSVWQVYAKQA